MTKPNQDIFMAIGNIGMATSVTISWGLNHSILWALLHGTIGWFYVIYYAIWIK
jgi:hypothetical protein